MRGLLLLGLLFATPSAFAKPQCYADPRTEEHTCYDDALVSQREGIRYSPIYRGGPRQIERTGFEFAVNCGTGVIHTKDRNGVSFAGGHRGDSPVATEMVDGICAAQLRGVKIKK